MDTPRSTPNEAPLVVPTIPSDAPSAARGAAETAAEALYDHQMGAVRAACRDVDLAQPPSIGDALELTLCVLGVEGPNIEPTDDVASLRSELETAREERDLANRARQRVEAERDRLRRTVSASQGNTAQVRHMGVAAS